VGYDIELSGKAQPNDRVPNPSTASIWQLHLLPPIISNCLPPRSRGSLSPAPPTKGETKPVVPSMMQNGHRAYYTCKRRAVSWLSI
jgi:hypothetical protein